MNLFTDARWLIALNALPVLLLLYFGYQQFTLVEPLLDEIVTGRWVAVGWATLAYLLLVVTPSSYFALARKKLPLPALVLAFAVT